MTDNKCTVCGEKVDWNIAVEEFDYIFKQVDNFGEYSLTEDKQLVYNGKICSRDCYELL